MKNEELRIKIGILAAGGGKAGRRQTAPEFPFLRSKKRTALSAETGRPLCGEFSVSLKNGKKSTDGKEHTISISWKGTPIKS